MDTAGHTKNQLAKSAKLPTKRLARVSVPVTSPTPFAVLTRLVTCELPQSHSFTSQVSLVSSQSFSSHSQSQSRLGHVRFLFLYHVRHAPPPPSQHAGLAISAGGNVALTKELLPVLYVSRADRENDQPPTTNDSSV